jgi:hypothetical protein
MTYAVRAIDITIQLGTGSFGASGENTVTLSGMRVNAQLACVLPPGATTAVIQIYGMTLSQINQLATAGLVYGSRRNLISVSAGDATAGMTTVFRGIIIEAVPKFAQAPNTFFLISATSTADLQLKPVKPGTFKGGTDVAMIMSQMAQVAGLGFENNGVSVQLSNPYFPGTITQQIYSCAKAANIYAYIDRVSNTLVIVPKGGSRSGSTPLISPATGMIGYPDFQQFQIILRTLFNPVIEIMKPIQVQSQLMPANGKWLPIQIDYNLASQEVDGPWETVVTAIPLGRGQ